MSLIYKCLKFNPFYIPVMVKSSEHLATNLLPWNYIDMSSFLE